MHFQNKSFKKGGLLKLLGSLGKVRSRTAAVQRHYSTYHSVPFEHIGYAYDSFSRSDSSDCSR